MNLTEVAATILQAIKEDGKIDHSMNQQVLCLFEEVGEFVQAYRRWSGQARKEGSFNDMAKELADIVIVSYVTAEALGIDLEEAVEEKLSEINNRGGF